MSPNAARLWGLNPFGPIFDKELRITARRKRNHLLRVLYLGGLLLFLLMIYANTRNYGYAYGATGVAARVQAQNQLGKNFFATFSMFCVIAMGLIAPVLTSTAISAERLGKTLPVLLITPITSWQIICGKLFSRLLVALMLIGLSLPVLAVVRLLGGVETFQMFSVICLCTAFALSSAALGLFYSTLMNRAYAVILLSYGTMFVMYLAGPLILGLFAAAAKVRQTTIFPIVAAVNPVANVALLSMPDSPAVLSAGWIPGLMVQLALTALLMTGSAAVLRRYARRGGEYDRPPQLSPLAILPGAQTAVQEVAVAPGDVPQDDTAVQRRPSVGTDDSQCVVGDNPVAWREFRRPLVGRRWAGLAALVVLGLLVLSYCAFASIKVLDDRELQMGYACVFNGLYWLLVAVLSATAIAQEKESDTWTLLLTTPLPARSIVMGKVMGIGRRLIWPTVLIAAHFAVFAMSRVISWTAAVHVLWVLISFNTVWLASGVYLSLRMQKVTTAVIINLMIPIGLFVVVPIMLLVLGELIARDDDWAEAMTWYLPYMWMAQSIERLAPRQFYNYDTRMWLPGWGYSVSLHEYTKMLLVTGVMHGLVASAVLWRTVKRFDRLAGRAAQDQAAVPPAGIEGSESGIVHR